jgi:hypothetical protein
MGAGAEQTAAARRTATAASAGVLVVELVGTLMLWAPIPAAWMWIGARVYDATGSLLADGTVVLVGFLGTTVLTMSALNRLDELWVVLRRRAGHDQAQGALTRVVIVSATVGLLAFWVWFHIIEKAFVIRFMPTQ